VSAYCTSTDAYRFVPPGLLANPGRLVASASSTTEILTLDGHGWVTGQEIIFRAESGGSLPSPLVAGTSYYAIVLTADTLRVATTLAGALVGSYVNLTTTGSSIVVVAPLPWDAWIAECSAMIDQTLPAHIVPLTGTIPEPIKSYAACLLAMRALAHVGAATQAVQGQLEFWQRQADKWARGVPLRGANVPTSANLAVVSVATDDRGWSRSDGRIL